MAAECELGAPPADVGSFVFSAPGIDVGRGLVVADVGFFAAGVADVVGLAAAEGVRVAGLGALFDFVSAGFVVAGALFALRHSPDRSSFGRLSLFSLAAVVVAFSFVGEGDVAVSDAVPAAAAASGAGAGAVSPAASVESCCSSAADDGTTGRPSPSRPGGGAPSTSTCSRSEPPNPAPAADGVSWPFIPRRSSVGGSSERPAGAIGSKSSTAFGDVDGGPVPQHSLSAAAGDAAAIGAETASKSISTPPADDEPSGYDDVA